MHYLIEAQDLNAHLFHIQLTLPASAAPTLLKLPVWIPGSYMVREFSRHVVRISARAGKRVVAVEQVEKNAWRVAAASSERVVSYEVYAFDQSVRTAWLDAERGFFNGSSVFLYSDETRRAKHVVQIAAPADARCKDWQVCTTLKRAINHKGTKPFGFGEYEAADYDELIDKPVMLGNLQTLSFKAHGTSHEIVITGAGAFESKRLAADVQRICETQIVLFDPKHTQAPFERYVFMLHASGDGYGGLEHRDCTALLAKRDDLPRPGVAEMSDGYATLLGLFSHEYFHAWNVKRIKPQRFEPYDLERENLTRLLWLFEGFTSYYDDLLLLRAGVIDEVRYLKLLSKSITTVLSMPGRHVESVADASFNAWIKYYRADENTPNTTISYYQKGALVALAIDAMLRRDTKHTLDDVMRYLYARYLQSKPGVGEDEMPALLHEKFGLDKKLIQSFFERHVNGTQDLPLQELLSSLSYALHEVSDGPSGNTTLGGRLDARDEGVFVAMVVTAGALQQAGLARGDVIVALDGEQCNRARWESVRQKLKPKQASVLHYFRDGSLRETALTPQLPGIKEWSVQRSVSAVNATWPRS